MQIYGKNSGREVPSVEEGTLLHGKCFLCTQSTPNPHNDYRELTCKKIVLVLRGKVQDSWRRDEMTLTNE